MPLLSVIIPVYNVEQYLKECLDSVLAQNLESMEVICVNDGSTDGSLEILEHYATQYTNLQIITQPNGGLSAARNTGLRAATGKWVYFLDSDDWLYPDALQKVVEVAEERQVDALCVNVLANGKEPYYSLEACVDEVLDSTAFMQAYFKQVHMYYMTQAWMYVFSRTFLMDNNLFFIEGLLHEDVEFTPRMLYAAKRVSLYNIPIQYHRVGREGSIMHTRNMKRFIDQLWIFRHLYDFFADKEDVGILRGVLWWITIQALQYGKQIGADLSLFTKKDIINLQQCARTRFEYRVAKLMAYNKSFALRYFEQRLPKVCKKCINRFIPALQYEN